MIRRSLPFIYVSALLAPFLAGCSNSKSIGTCNCPTNAAPVSISMTDDPPAGVSVLFFEVTLTSATATSSSGSPAQLLPETSSSVPIDVTQLQAASAFLSLSALGPGTYTALNLTFANPQLVIYNQSDTSLGSNCAVGSVCQLTPAFDNNSSSLSFTTSPFPITASANTPMGFLIDFRLNTVIQSDLSVNLSVANGVTVSALPAATAAPQWGTFMGTVQSVSPSTDQFTVQTPWAPNLIVGAPSGTLFNNFPSSACTTPGIGCLAQGQIVRVHVSSLVPPGGFLVTASEVDYVQAASAQTVEGTIIQLIPPTDAIAGAPPTLVVLLHANPANATGFPLGGIADVLIAPAGTSYSIDSNGFTMPSGLTFTGPSDLAVGQAVTLTVEPGTVSTTGSGPAEGTWGPPPSISFNASNVELETSQMTGTIFAIDAGTTSFTLGVGSPFFAPWPLPSAVSSYDVAATSQTNYTGLSPDNFNGLAASDFVSVNGWLFPPTTAGGGPTIAAQSVMLRTAALF